jgi:alpha-tubulin suppressor-like RCC1 family protein
VLSTGALLIDRSLILKVRPFVDGAPAGDVMRSDFWITGSIADGKNHTLALRSDGTVWSWGANGSGQLGDGSSAMRTSPASVPGLPATAAVAAGAEHSLALGQDGTLWSWGRNNNGQLGDGTTTDHSAPIAIIRPAEMGTVIAIAAGDQHSLALTSDGAVWAWGGNTNGEIGDGTIEMRLTPVRVSATTGMSNIVAVAAGANHNLALTSAGRLWAWGLNTNGQLGDGTASTQISPVSVSAASIAAGALIGISAQGHHSLGVRPDHSLWSWGADEKGQLGHGVVSTAPQTQMAPVMTLSGLFEAAHANGGSSHSLAVKQDGSSWAWGGNDAGQLGDGTTSNRAVPTRVLAIEYVVDASGGERHSTALSLDGLVHAWGDNATGQLGDGTTTSQPIPVTASSFRAVESAWVDEDPDQDGLTTAAEYFLGTDPLKWDSNDDGIGDGESLQAGFDPAHLDIDGDGLTNAYERQLGTNPFQADTDGDGVNDRLDAFPLDPTRWDATPTDPDDATPPVITLIEPRNAVVLP